MEAGKAALRHRIFFGKTLWQRIRTSDIEFSRKAALLVTIACLALSMLVIFSAVSFLRGDYFHSAINAAVLCVVAGSYLYLRARGELTTVAFVFIGVLSVQFISDFLSDTNRAMWSYTIPVISFYLLGTRRAAVYSTAYLGILTLLMFFEKSSAYSADFKIRFLAIYFCVALFSFFFERTRQKTQEMLNKNRQMLQIQRDIGIAMGSESEITTALNRVLLILIAHLKDIDCGGIYLVGKDSGALHLVAHKGFPLEFITKVSWYSAETPNTRVVMKGNPVYTAYDTAYTNLGVPLDKVRQKENLKAIAIVPVKSEGRVIAAISLASHRTEELQLETKVLLESVASNLGDSISRMVAEHDLRILSSRNRAILEAVPDIIMEVDINKVYKWANKAGHEFFGDDVIGREAAYYFEGTQDTHEKVSPVFTGSEEIVYVESWQRRKDGEKRLLAWWCRSLKNDRGDPAGALSSARDITENRAVEEQLRQSQKMEAIGQLAGGIAHDFNNQLAAITGFAELICKKAEGNEKLCHYADTILLSSKRAADLTNQLLAFARKGKYRAMQVNVHCIIGEVITMLRHTVDRKITLKQELNAKDPLVMGDPTQLQNALLNVAINSRDAMPEGGELIFSTEIRVLDEEYCRKQPYELTPGRYCEICVTDSGLGMNAEAKKHLFEPFFTTKEKGKGTGMGLPAVYGIVKSHKGAIDVCSEPGHGTTVKIYLPAIGEAVETGVSEHQADRPAVPGAKKLNILFVDDEKIIREMAKEMFEYLGHMVVECENGRKAVDYYRTSWKSVDVVILDMIMPEMGGKEAFVAMRGINPRIKAVLSSGYSVDGEAQQIMNEGMVGFLQKPFRAEAMVDILSRVMKG